MKKMSVKKRISLVVMLVSLVIAFFCGYKLISNHMKNAENERSEEEMRANREKIEASVYYMETAYEGADVPYQLYEVSFDDENSKDYCCNSNLVNILGDDFIEKYLNYADEYAMLLFGSNYHDISSDTEAFQESIFKFYESADTTILLGDEEITPQEFANRITEMYVDNKLECTARFETDRSLFYRRDYTYYVRGALYITPSSAQGKKGKQCKALYENYGIECNYGETVCIMTEIAFCPSQQALEVMGIHLMQYIEQ